MERAKAFLWQLKPQEAFETIWGSPVVAILAFQNTRGTFLLYPDARELASSEIRLGPEVVHAVQYQCKLKRNMEAQYHLCSRLRLLR